MAIMCYFKKILRIMRGFFLADIFYHLKNLSYPYKVLTRPGKCFLESLEVLLTQIIKKLSYKN